MTRTSPRPIAATAIVALLFACDTPEPDAWGNFEATEVTVSAESTGTLVRFDPREGDDLAAGTEVAQVDADALDLQRVELEGQAALADARGREVAARLRALEAQLAIARDDLERTRRLHSDGVATASAMSRAEGQTVSLEEQVEAARVGVSIARRERALVDTRIAQMDDRIRRTRVVNPSRGTVLRTFVEPGEFVQAGRPLYSVAPLDTLTLRAWVSGDQLARVRIGGSVRVHWDAGDGTLAERDGRVTWIASRAEFTPTPIQTREERVDQVYAIKIAVANPDGALKIGMPAEVEFGEAATPGTPASNGPDEG